MMAVYRGFASGSANFFSKRQRALWALALLNACMATRYAQSNPDVGVKTAALSIAPVFSVDFDEQSLEKLGALYPEGRDFAFIEGRNGRPAVQFFGMRRASMIQIPNRPALQFTDGASFDLWARVDKSEGMDGFGNLRAEDEWSGMALIAKSSDRLGFGLYVTPTYDRAKNTVLGHIGSYDQTWIIIACDFTQHFASMPIGEWFRFTGVVSRQKGLKWYFNKKLYASCLNTRPRFQSANGEDLYIGQTKSKWAPLYGSIQDLRIYSVALTPEQVSALP